ncbi:hypothetical protein HPB49_008230 [Dermacentor silvarum]|uniref:Uncharacterized protein n=1 Tax=Dermacentor silvarum TaxID=543639 RepID=A0ACB8CQM9_DERSI|nr:hypothetical protein HPB49_008230 [Dermacentor silvarum]
MDDLHVVMELIESESEEKELDAVLCQVGAELVRSDRNRIPRYYEEVVASEEVIAWPSDQERANIKARFLARSNGKGPRNTIGCVDGCHIEIPHQKESPASYYNRKKFPSIVLQGICDSSSRFIDVFVGYPGFAHDARVLKESPIYSVAETKCANDYLLGDAAYPLLP